MTSEPQPISLLTSGLVGAVVGITGFASIDGIVIRLFFLAIGLSGIFCVIRGANGIYRLNKKD